MSDESSTFSAIIAGEQEGTIIARDDEQRFALIQCLEPEAAVHWLAVPFEYGYGTEEMLTERQDRFAALMRYAVKQTEALIPDYPILGNGFTVKLHVGAFETIPHAKLHVLSSE